jgi:putative Ca2+/H+ antiporter (TMEM165/GDT1 family)
MEWLAAALTAIVLIIPIELPDKTFVATLVLATRYRPLPVWLGVVAAFGVQCLVAVAAGRLVQFLPELFVRLLAATTFAIGAVVLLRQAIKTGPPQRPPEYVETIDVPGPSALRAALSSFLVLFVAEWGDLSQLLTAGLVAGGRPPIPVFLGSWIGLAVVAGAAVLLGKVLTRWVPVTVVRYVAAGICAVLALVTVWTVV